MPQFWNSSNQAYYHIGVLVRLVTGRSTGMPQLWNSISQPCYHGCAGSARDEAERWAMHGTVGVCTEISCRLHLRGFMLLLVLSISHP